MTPPAQTGPAAAHHRPVTPATGTANHAPGSQSADSYLRPCGLRPGNRTAANPAPEKSVDFGVMSRAVPDRQGTGGRDQPQCFYGGAFPRPAS